jgi:succinate dehydrogenase/fumarate reductase flavoprotein subunit
VSETLKDCDVLVLGGGMSGLVAAITALEKGARVTLAEKSSGLGGSMALSNGLIWTFSDKGQLRSEIPQGDDALQDLIADRLLDGLKWLLSNGVVLDPEQTFQWYGFGRRANPAQMVPALEERARSLGAIILTNTALDHLLIERGAVVGAQLYGDQGVCDIRANATVLATGGFQGNPELVGRYITHHAHALYLRSNPFSTGDGLLAALTAGAATSELLHSFYGHAMAAPPARFNRLEFQSISQKYGVLSVAINLDGKRFTDETQGTGEEDLNFCIAQQREATAIYVVDSHIANMEWKDNAPGRVAIGRAKSAGGPVLEADSLLALADKLATWGIPSDQALHTFKEYNDAITGGFTDRLKPPRRKHRVALAEGPFTAVKVKAGITYTCGGLKADLDMGVARRSRSVSTLNNLRADASDLRLEPIPGLFAAGCDVGGISNWGYMGGLSQALVTGRIAGESAADAALACRR